MNTPIKVFPETLETIEARLKQLGARVYQGVDFSDEYRMKPIHVSAPLCTASDLENRLVAAAPQGTVAIVGYSTALASDRSAHRPPYKTASGLALVLNEYVSEHGRPLMDARAMQP
ncbi:MAG: hypothetical protein EPN86_03395 [Nanoarchaeota archaeon]|nr:MAG: hypothetical protein EPN86_03395 [Nanoarchaeota archaeon]